MTFTAQVVRSPSPQAGNTCAKPSPDHRTLTTEYANVGTHLTGRYSIGNTTMAARTELIARSHSLTAVSCFHLFELGGSHGQNIPAARMESCWTRPAGNPHRGGIPMTLWWRDSCTVAYDVTEVRSATQARIFNILTGTPSARTPPNAPHTTRRTSKPKPIAYHLTGAHPEVTTRAYTINQRPANPTTGAKNIPSFHQSSSSRRRPSSTDMRPGSL